MTDETPTEPVSEVEQTTDETVAETTDETTADEETTTADTNADGADAVTGEANEEEAIAALKEVIDPELMINIVDLGLIYEVTIDGPKVNVDMTLTSPACPAGPQLLQQSKMALERLPGVEEADIKLVMSPPWSPDRMTDDARDQLGIF